MYPIGKVWLNVCSQADDCQNRKSLKKSSNNRISQVEIFYGKICFSKFLQFFWFFTSVFSNVFLVFFFVFRCFLEFCMFDFQESWNIFFVFLVVLVFSRFFGFLHF